MMIGMNLFARRSIEKTFAALSRGEWTRSTNRMAADVHHVFPGDHPLGGERHSRDAVLRWFERLGRLYPGHDFEVRRVSSRGSPWDI
jgi:ketosteroid isomerase-like protein